MAETGTVMRSPRLDVVFRVPFVVCSWRLNAKGRRSFRRTAALS